jgi:hypothetical protein
MRVSGTRAQKGKSEIYQFAIYLSSLQLGSQHDMIWLHVSVNHTPRMTICDSVENLRYQVHNEIFLQSFMFSQQCAAAPTRKILENDDEATCFPIVPILMDLDNSRVVQSAQYAHFLFRLFYFVARHPHYVHNLANLFFVRGPRLHEVYVPKGTFAQEVQNIIVSI